MLKKLRSVFGSHKVSLSLLLLKSSFFSGLWFLTAKNWLFWPIFLGFPAFFYFRRPWTKNQTLGSFLMFLSTAFLSILFLQGEGKGDLRLWIFAGFFGLLFFLFFGIKELIFIRSQSVYYFLNNLLFLGLLMLFFTADKFRFFSFKFLLLGAAIFFLSREFLFLGRGIWDGEFAPALGPKQNLTALSFAFLTLESVWAASLLPIGVANSALFLLFYILALKEVVISSFEGRLTREAVLKSGTIFIFGGFLVFALSKWTP